jgi:3-dehydroquinate synthase
MVCETYLSAQKCGLPMDDALKIENFILQTFGKIDIMPNETSNIVKLCHQDKKNVKGMINFSLLKKIGVPLFNIGVEQNEIKKVIQQYAQH